MHHTFLAGGLLLVCSGWLNSVLAAELWVGTADVSITPDRPVSLAGQFHQRIARKVDDPCMASLLALETRANGRPVDQAIMVALEVVTVPADVHDRFRALLKQQLPDFDVTKAFLAPTHTHTAPTLNQDRFSDYADAMQPEEYVPWMLERLVAAVVQAWEGRRRGAMAWGLGHAVVGHNRRVTYANGTAEMYGATKRKDFIGLEGWEDHALDILCFVDDAKQLIATAMVVPSPAQMVGTSNHLSSDYWGPVRAELKRRYGDQLVVLGLCGPAGDMIPYAMLRKDAETRMERLRKLSRKAELGRRIVAAFEDVWPVIRQELVNDLHMVHRVERFDLPGRIMTEKEYKDSMHNYKSLEQSVATAKDEQEKSRAESRMRWFKRVVDSYEVQQKTPPSIAVEMHVLRLGDVVMATNPFELFTDYAMRIQGRSPAPQTVLIQLASPVDQMYSYLPSERAVKAGGYSAVPQSTPVGPVGGQILVEKTLQAISDLFRK